MKILLSLLITIMLSSCVIMKKAEYDTLRRGQPKPYSVSHNSGDNLDFLKDGITQRYLDSNKVCDLSFLLKLISTSVNKLGEEKFDEYRINNIKDELVRVLKKYQSSSFDQSGFKITEEELKIRVRCYIDYMLDPKNKFVAWYEFWEDSYYRKLNCK